MSRAEGPDALSLDVWYTLLYQTAPERAAYERARLGAWTRTLAEAGVPAARKVRALVAESRRRERAGRAFSLDEQSRWLSRWPRLDPRVVARRLDAAVREARVRVAPGALAMLDRLRRAGVPVGLVSNVTSEPSESIRALLERTGLARRVAEVVLSSEVGAAKPDPRPLRLLARRLGFAPSRMLHVGDTDLDILGAWRAGVPAARYVGVRRHWPSRHRPSLGAAERAVPRVQRWSDFPQHLAATWAAARPALDRTR